MVCVSNNCEKGQKENLEDWIPHEDRDLLNVVLAHFNQRTLPGDGLFVGGSPVAMWGRTADQDSCYYQIGFHDKDGKFNLISSERDLINRDYSDLIIRTFDGVFVKNFYGKDNGKGFYINISNSDPFDVFPERIGKLMLPPSARGYWEKLKELDSKLPCRPLEGLDFNKVQDRDQLVALYRQSVGGNKLFALLEMAKGVTRDILSSHPVALSHDPPIEWGYSLFNGIASSFLELRFGDNARISLKSVRNEEILVRATSGSSSYATVASIDEFTSNFGTFLENFMDALADEKEFSNRSIQSIRGGPTTGEFQALDSCSIRDGNRDAASARKAELLKNAMTPEEEEELKQIFEENIPRGFEDLFQMEDNSIIFDTLNDVYSDREVTYKASVVLSGYDSSNRPTFSMSVTRTKYVGGEPEEGYLGNLEGQTTRTRHDIPQYDLLHNLTNLAQNTEAFFNGSAETF